MEACCGAWADTAVAALVGASPGTAVEGSGRLEETRVGVGSGDSADVRGSGLATAGACLSVMGGRTGSRWPYRVASGPCVGTSGGAGAEALNCGS